MPVVKALIISKFISLNMNMFVQRTIIHLRCITVSISDLLIYLQKNHRMPTDRFHNSLFRRTCAFFTMLVLLLHFTVIFSQISVRDIPRLNQLPVNSIHRIFQDKEGYIWYGTVDGLCRDDGYNILVFRSDFKNPGTMLINLVLSIAEDSHHRIWIGTQKGVYILDKSNFRISSVNIPELNDQPVPNIFTTSDGHIWISSSINSFRFSDNEIISSDTRIQTVKLPGRINMLFEDKQHQVFVCLDGQKLCRLNRKTDKLEPLDAFGEMVDASDMIQDKDCYWISTWNKGILRLDLSAPTRESRYIYQQLPQNIAGQPCNTIYHLVQDNNSHDIWATGIDDLFVFRIQPDGRLSQVNTSGFLPQGKKMLFDIIKDREGNLWVSGFDTNSFTISFKANITDTYPITALKRRVKGNVAIVTLCRDKDFFWFTQERTGLCLYSPEDDRVKIWYDCPEVKNLPLGIVPYMIKSAIPNKIWAMTAGFEVFGLSRKNMDIVAVDIIDLRTVSKNAGVAECLYEDKIGNLWIGSMTGIYTYHPESKRLSVVKEGIGDISDFVQTNDGKVWATIRNKGICQINSNGFVKIIPFNKDFLCIDCTSDGKLWLGTGEGEVLCYNPINDLLEDYSLSCGMNGDMVDNIAVDQFNHVWIVTNQRIKEFNPANKALWTQEASDPENLLTRFMPRAMVKDWDGKLYFGGFGGIISQMPSQRLEGIPLPVKTRITSIKVLNRNLTFTENGQTTELLPGEQNLSIEFSSLDYQHTSKIRYAYRLNGVDDDWVYLQSGKNMAFYNGLEKGNYTFEVKATDKNGLWSKEVTQLRINRLPAWYETWFAITIYIALIMGASGYGLMLYLKYLKRKNDEKWSDSAELVKMHQYLESELHEPYTDFAEIDRLLMNRATKIIENQLNNPDFNVVSLAEAMNMSRSTLSRKIKIITSKTPLDLIKDIKMQHARQMLESKTASVTDVIVALGYNDHKNFTKSFKDAFGLNPSEYQKQVREKREDQPK